MPAENSANPEFKVLSETFKKHFFILLAVFISLVFSSGAQAESFGTDRANYYKARVLEVRKAVSKGREGVEEIHVEFLSGSTKGLRAVARNLIWQEEGYNLRLQRGEKIMVKCQRNSGGQLEFYVSGRCRSLYLFLAAVVFALFFLLCSGFKRWTALVAVIVNIAGVFVVIVPLLKAGWAPFATVLTVQSLTAAFTLRIVLGGGKKFFSALLGAVAGIAAGGVLALEFVRILNVSGVFFPGARILQIAFRYIQGWNFQNFKELFSATIMIASMGAVADVAVSVSSGCWEIALKSNKENPAAIWKSGINIGRDIIATMLNSLVLVFTALALPLISVLYILQIPFIRAINFEFFTAVVASALIASIALVLTVPATAAVCGATFKRQ